MTSQKVYPYPPKTCPQHHVPSTPKFKKKTSEHSPPLKYWQILKGPPSGFSTSVHPCMLHENNLNLCWFYHFSLALKKFSQFEKTNLSFEKVYHWLQFKTVKLEEVAFVPIFILFPKQIYQIENQKFFPLPHLHQHFRFLLS